MDCKARTKTGKVLAGFYIPADLHRAVKQRALDNGTSASDEVQAAIEAHLERRRLRVVATSPSPAN